MTNDELTPQSTKGKDGSARRWINELGKSHERFRRFLKEAKLCNEAYIGAKEDDSEKASAHMAIYWSNIETLAPALYSQTPKPVVARRFKDKNPVAREASELLERNTVYYAQGEYLDSIIKRDVASYLRVGLAVDWVRYVSKINDKRIDVEADEMGGYARKDNGESINPSALELMEDKDGTYYTESELEYEDVTCDAVHYADFRFGHCVVWTECPWVARRVRMRKDAATKRFGKDKASRLAYTERQRADSDDDEAEVDSEQKILFPEAEIWEIWSKEDRKVYWVSEGCPDLLDEKDDPLRLQNFFPCPKPLLASHTDDSLIPRADYIIYRKQVEYIDKLTLRIQGLTDALLLKGCYDAQFPELAELLDSNVEKLMIPVDNFATFMEKGGLEQMVKFMPVEVIAKTLQQLIQLRSVAVQDLYQITGLSDIMRGATDPRETATAQRVKGQFGALRLRERQRELQRYIRDLIAIKAEIIAEHFDPETILAVADAEPNETTIAALQLLKNDKLRLFRIDIETDSTIEADEIAEKQSANEFITAVTGFLDRALLFSERAPAYAPVMGEFLQFIARRFRAGRTMEETIDRATMEYQGQLQQRMQQPPPQDPKVIQAQQQMQLKQMEMQQDAQMDAMRLQQQQQKIAGDQALKKYEIDLEHDRKIQEAQAKHAMSAFSIP